MAPLQGSRLGEAETEGLLHGFTHFLSTVLFLDVFVVVGDSTTLWRVSVTENLFVSPVSSVLFLRLDLCAESLHNNSLPLRRASRGRSLIGVLAFGL